MRKRGAFGTRRAARSIGTLGSLAALALVEGRAAAQQTDLNPPLPDVLLMIDNSGSMERMIDGSLPEDTPANACDVSACQANSLGTTCAWAQNPPAAANRWNTLLQSLVGSPKNGFHCISMPRTPNSAFTDEYQIGGTFPYDTGYYLNYHRMVAADSVANPSVACVYAPGTLPGAAAGAGVGKGRFATGISVSADSFPSSPPAIITRPYGQPLVDQVTKTMPCNFDINTDGAVVQYQDLMRFAMMTFDQDPSAGTGVSPASPYSVLPQNPFDGMWSYFPNWGGGGTPLVNTGAPNAACALKAFEVGARNPAAPPWEGRLVPFPPPSPPNDTTAARQTQNQQIRSVLSATRPYGATPLAGMFEDAKYFFWTDPIGPSHDPYVSGGCRQQFIILLTDGAPNQDLRETCGSLDNPSAPCPYNHPEYTAQTLLAGSAGKSVITYVIGFALSSGQDQGGTLVQCSQLGPNGPSAADCANPSPQLQPCCELWKIAVQGAPPGNPAAVPPVPPPRAYFANTAGDLQAALADILARIAQQSTTRTTPSYSPVIANVAYTANSSVSNQNTFYSYFNPAHPVPASGAFSNQGTPWTGDIQRNRYLCSQSPPAQAVDKSKGDDFAQDLGASTSRNFLAFQPYVVNGAVDSAGTFRPYASATNVGDGMLSNAGYGVLGQQVDGSASDVIGAMLNTSPSPLGLPATNSCQYTSTTGTGLPYLTLNQCTNMLLDFTMGQSFSGPSDFQFMARTGANALGGIFHATPVVVGPPNSNVRDDAYDQFRAGQNVYTNIAQMAPSGTTARDTIAYAATTDGLLHAFWTDVSSLTQNEEWAFMPPAVMPLIKSAYPAANQFLLDGLPVVRDVVWDRLQGAPMNPVGNNPWHTTLVASFGPTQQGYYALDVSNPKFTRSQQSARTAYQDAPGQYGPLFMWQLTKMPATNMPLFGSHSTTPAITQIAYGNPVHEVGVAILPGGWDSAAQTGGSGCQRDTVARPTEGDWSVPTTDSIPYAFRHNVRCWGTRTGGALDPVVGRSVSIVRLDTGEVLATFARKYDARQYYPNDTLLTATPSRIIDTPLDSPMTGTPAVFPDQVGVDATKFFIADMDGTIWRFDISSPDPTQWKGRLFFDLYNGTADTSLTSWVDGQPVVLPLVTSLDRSGRTVIHAASGSQDTFDTSGPNYVASLTEKIQTPTGGQADFHAAVNWYMGSQVPVASGFSNDIMSQGERVSGPMTVFDSRLYFATYSPASGTVACSQGDPRLWVMDFVNPNSGSPPNKGGIAMAPSTSSNQYVDLAQSPYNAPAGSVVPGFAIQQTTACAQVAQGADGYVPGTTHTTISQYTPSTYSLVAQVGAPKTGGGIQTISMPVKAPSAPTVIDSWAAITE
jgi:type IV pilus assembly protein PilY1